MLEAGIEGSMEITVTRDRTARQTRPCTLDVFATPAMIELIEETAWRSVADRLDEGCASVGTGLDVRHLSATPVGMKVTCRTWLKEVDGRRLLFGVLVEDEAGKIGEGTHERFVIQAEKFQQKTDAKKAGR